METIILSILASYGIYNSIGYLDCSEKLPPRNSDEELSNKKKDFQKNQNVSQIQIKSRIFNAFNFYKEYLSQSLSRNNVFNIYLAIFIVELAYKTATK